MRKYLITLFLTSVLSAQTTCDKLIKDINTEAVVAHEYIQEGDEISNHIALLVLDSADKKLFDYDETCCDTVDCHNQVKLQKLHQQFLRIDIDLATKPYNRVPKK